MTTACWWLVLCGCVRHCSASQWPVGGSGVCRLKVRVPHSSIPDERKVGRREMLHSKQRVRAPILQCVGRLWRRAGGVRTETSVRWVFMNWAFVNCSCPCIDHLLWIFFFSHIVDDIRSFSLVNSMKGDNSYLNLLNFLRDDIKILVKMFFLAD